MYVNNREEINYHSFMTALRNMRGYSLKKVCKGVCGESGMNRFEKGNRVAEKLVRDRLVARLGISCEKYEDYLQPKEYARWEQRQQIIQAVEERRLDVAKQKLKAYEKTPGLNSTNQQFIEAMRFMILTIEGASEERRYISIERAVKLTVADLEEALKGEHLLSDQEVNLILEQMYLAKSEAEGLDEAVWRISEYEKLLHYIEGSCWEKLQKAKVYPKVVYYIGLQLVKLELSENELRQGIKRCQDAIELLRDTGLFYYLSELAELGFVLAERLKAFLVSDAEHYELENWVAKSKTWKSAFTSLCAEYKVDAGMLDFCYLYCENECHNIVNVLEYRRKMLGLSRSKLGEGICSAKTIVRFEREGVNPSLELVRRLFEKMGICAEYRRSRVLTTDVNALLLSNEVVRNINSGLYEDGKSNLKRLKKLLCMDISYNKQEVLRWETILGWKRQAFGKEELLERTKRALEYTLPTSVLGESEEMFLSRNEWLLVYDLAFKTTGELQASSVQMIEDYYVSKMKKRQVRGCIYVLELLGGGLASFLGNEGQYEKSNQISEALLRECLFHKRSGVLSELLYNKIYNIMEQSPNLSDMDRKATYDALAICVALSEFTKKYSWKEFFLNKQKDYI